MIIFSFVLFTLCLRGNLNLKMYNYELVDMVLLFWALTQKIKVRNWVVLFVV